MKLNLRYNIFLLLIVISTFSIAQNIVPNQSFEKAWTCPQHYTTDPVKELIPSWGNPNRGTPDYYHLCSDSIMGVPENFAGYAYPVKGSAYIGIILRETFDSCTNTNGVSREYVQAELTEPLVAEQLYCVRLNYILANKCVYSVDALGVAITRNKIEAKDAGQIIQKPQVTNLPGHIMDNGSDWTEMTGTFRARGGEKYFSIGNFWDNDLTQFNFMTDTINCDSNFVYAYYYIDDVWLYSIDSEFDCISPNEYSVGSDWLSDNYDPRTGYNSLNLKNTYDLYGKSKDYNDSDDLANNSDGNNTDDSSRNSSDDGSNNINDGNSDSNNNASSDSSNNNGNNDNNGNINSSNSGNDNSVNNSDSGNSNSDSGNSNSDSGNNNSDSGNNNSNSDSNNSNSDQNGNSSGNSDNDGSNNSSQNDTEDGNDTGHMLKSEISETAFLNAGVGDTFKLNRIFFEFNSAELLGESFSELDTLTNIMLNSGGLRIEIRGHSDNIGSERYNRKLSIERAATVYEFLIGKGIDKSRMKYRGFGNLVPLSDNDTEDGRRLNRRVEIIIVEL